MGNKVKETAPGHQVSQGKATGPREAVLPQPGADLATRLSAGMRARAGGWSDCYVKVGVSLYKVETHRRRRRQAEGQTALMCWSYAQALELVFASTPVNELPTTTTSAEGPYSVPAGHRRLFVRCSAWQGIRERHAGEAPRKLTCQRSWRRKSARKPSGKSCSTGTAHLPETMPRVRTMRGSAKQKFREVDLSNDEAKRRRQVSANRILGQLKAALNHALRVGKITDERAPWRNVAPFRGVNTLCVRYLSVKEARRLVNATDAKFRPLVEAALATGCRYSELCRLTVADFNSDSGTLFVQQSKSDKPRHVVLTDEGVELAAPAPAALALSACSARNGRPVNRLAPCEQHLRTPRSTLLSAFTAYGTLGPVSP